MPGRDGTGPYGIGPRSGRGFGPCTGYPVQPFIGYGCGCGFGCGRGHRLMRYGYPVVPQDLDADEEKALLQDQVKYLESQLEVVKTQLKKFEK